MRGLTDQPSATAEIQHRSVRFPAGARQVSQSVLSFQTPRTPTALKVSESMIVEGTAKSTFKSYTRSITARSSASRSSNGISTPP